MKRSLPTMILTAAAVSACIGCAAPVEPHLKSAHSYQVPVDLENVALLARHGQAALYPFSTPHCPYYYRPAKMWHSPPTSCPCGHDAACAPAPVETQPAASETEQGKE